MNESLRTLEDKSCSDDHVVEVSRQELTGVNNVQQMKCSSVVQGLAPAMLWLVSMTLNGAGASSLSYR